MNNYIFDLDWTLYSDRDVNLTNTSYFYNSFRKKEYLNKLLGKLKGNKYIFSNGNKAHVMYVVQHMKLKSIFKNNIAYAELYDKIKPDISAYNYMIDKFKLNKHQSIYFFEDSVENLKKAKELGWNTVLIDPNVGNSTYMFVDYIFTNVEEAILFFITIDKIK